MPSWRSMTRSVLRGTGRAVARAGRAIDEWLAGPPSPDGDAMARRAWFDEHYGWAADELAGMLADAEVSLAGAYVADVGSGDGIIDLGLAQRYAPAGVTGFDVVPTNRVYLFELAREAGIAVSDDLPLHFEASEPARFPTPDDAFDVVVSWSAFEHVADPRALLAEVRRVLRPGGHFCCQVRPLYYSRHGSHLERWFPEGWVHLEASPEEVEARVRALEPSGDTVDYMLREYGTLNRLTLDAFGEALADAEFEVVRIQLDADRVELPPGASRRWPLSHLATQGFMLLAR